MLPASADGVAKEHYRCDEDCGAADDDNQLDEVVLTQGVQQTTNPGVLNQIHLNASVQLPDNAREHVNHFGILSRVLQEGCGTVHHAMERRTERKNHIGCSDDHPHDGGDLLELLVPDGNIFPITIFHKQRTPIGDGVLRKSSLGAQPNQVQYFGQKGFVFFFLSHYNDLQINLCVSRVERGITPLQTALAGSQWKVILCPDTLIISLKKYQCQIRQF